ncbi:ABC-type lipoprotein export system ATPase subunit [Anaeroplasma bactoclasticum]|jgi:putative ABC transport system permease protein|uniref:ABC-type lipoprotein export system ATPase subunit n=2 Tax=Anaeroplasma bactoclasticum TaxID=2088 RepID=A0A397QUX5_9MOLU|nr:ABC transporter ATP-binding protein/permease [Anaeroplasma bactoclasticum]RIA64868.1 ABC-type lipoprotein export system ATPase subunit [Anaeroplasma bactoclasticum]
MLRLENIRKNYYVADLTVEALKGVNLNFRKNEFVSILGPSGCGKTTLLNIIGGLDQYTSGDLIINGRSTKEFEGHDWDVYRNHRIGFIFQSYNLIPHQTVLGNVELALTIAGISKNERVARAKKALDRVGLKGQYYKKPNQMSGGQCQRVAIARALVNEPEILLADEPTGALDTETSIQIMDLIKEIAEERLVIMVTHNPDLAYKYSTRIVKFLDGEVVEDSNPFAKEDEIKEVEEAKAAEANEAYDEAKIKKERAKMSLWTAFKLSARNLHSKFKRTFMVALAGCIGIVGVSTVLAVSNGVQGYINDLENDMLAGYPVAITSSSLDYTNLLGGGLMSNTDDVNSEGDRSKLFIASLVRTLYNMNGVTSTNEITQGYMDFLADMPKDYTELIQYKYGYQIAPNIYTDFKTADGVTHQMSVAAIQATYASVLNNVEEFKDYSSMISSVTVMTEAPSNASYIGDMYEVLYLENGMTLEEVFQDKSSLIAVASKNSNTLNDLELAEYGYFSQEQFLNYCYRVGNSDLYVDNPILDIPETISYEDLATKKFTWYPNDTVYTKGSTDDDFGDKYYASAYSDGTLANETEAKYDNYRRNAFSDTGSVELNVKCVLRLKDDHSYGAMSSGGLYYTEALTKYMREQNLNSTICNSAKDQENTLYNVEVGYNFRFDGNSSKSLETYYLTSSGSSIMSYISQFLGATSGSKQVSTYSLSALGGAKFPTSISFYTSTFEQKDKLCAYLDKWNEDNAINLYKQNKEGYYEAVSKNDKGEEIISYYYYDKSSDSFYLVALSSDKYALDYNGNQYKLVVSEDNKDASFYKKLADKVGDAFFIDGQVEVTNNYSINAYSLGSYILFGDQFESSNIYYDSLEVVKDKDNNPRFGGYLYSYLNSEGEAKYVMKVQNQSYYKLALDKDGNVMSVRNGYDKYRYVEAENAFYKDEYVLVTSGGVPVLDADGNKQYTIKSTKVDSEDLKDIYAEDKVYSYANVVKNPTYTIAGNEYTLDTLGLYIDMTNLGDLDFSKVKVDTINKVITLEDYSIVDFYYKDETDTGFKYYYVDYSEEEKNGTVVSYIHANDISKYLDTTNLGNTDVSGFISDLYILNEDGSLSAVSADFSTDPLTIAQMLELKVVREKLEDKSILTIDDSLKIEYTDMIGIIITMVNTLIQIITYALIAFTALSLVVSTVMIGIITYVSVVERVKEIGVIRALGGRKKDVSHLFNAETLIIGFSAGVLGIVITYLLSLLINIVLGAMVGVYTIAALPWYQAIIMIAISVFLTMIAGLIPASSAAKKDPVVALRTE